MNAKAPLWTATEAEAAALAKAQAVTQAEA